MFKVVCQGISSLSHSSTFTKMLKHLHPSSCQRQVQNFENYCCGSGLLQWLEGWQQLIPHCDLWHFLHHVNGCKQVQNMKKITGQTETLALKQCSILLKEMDPSLSVRPTRCSFVTQVRWTLLADSCQRRLRRLHWERWHPDCENFDAIRLQVAQTNNHINGRQ